jgi:DNA-binding NtrC family response regulator
MEFAASILVVEDDPQQVRLYAQALAGFRVTFVATGTAALAAVEQRLPDLIILDHVLQSGERGLDFLPRFKAVAAHVPVIVVSGTLDVRAQIAALSGPGSAHYVIEKPVDVEELLRTVRHSLDECGLAETVAELRSLEQAERIESGDRERLFTERLARQMELIRRFRGAASRPNISQLAEEFRVDRKTIRRDLHDLVARGQLPASVRPETEAPA